EIQVSGRFKLDELDTNLQIIADTLKINIEHPAPGRYRLGALRQSTR
ncbi:MAG: iron dicitrate transport regulator FecR, partial [Nitrosomonas sp. PRO5]|nr:iron dicitrate transport regulator FecR [Nitrosomonas sp. PRO5]